MTDRVLVYEHEADLWRIADGRLPYKARGLFGGSAFATWDHRGAPQTDEFTWLGGGFDGSNYRTETFRFYTR